MNTVEKETLNNRILNILKEYYYKIHVFETIQPREYKIRQVLYNFDRLFLTLN